MFTTVQICVDKQQKNSNKKICLLVLLSAYKKIADYKIYLLVLIVVL